MHTPYKLTPIQRLNAIHDHWRQTLLHYSQRSLKRVLFEEWPEDPNVTGTINFDLPPSFQPGYVGRDYFTSSPRVLIVARNPGTGRSPEAQKLNETYSSILESYASGRTEWDELIAFIASQILQWNVYAGKGIFREDNDSVIALLQPQNRLSIHEISYVNAFPFKTHGSNVPPFRTRFSEEIWKTYASPFIAMLEPEVVVHFPDSDHKHPDLESIRGVQKVIRVWHPSNYNVRTRPSKVRESWRALDEVLRTDSNERPRIETAVSPPRLTPGAPSKESVEEQFTPAEPGFRSGKDSTVVRLRQDCFVSVTSASSRLFTLEIYCGEKRIGEYERSNQNEIDRKIGEVSRALTFLMNIYDRHGEWTVRWDGARRCKSIRVRGKEVDVLPKEYWGRPSWR